MCSNSVCTVKETVLKNERKIIIRHSKKPTWEIQKWGKVKLCQLSDKARFRVGWETMRKSKGERDVEQTVINLLECNTKRHKPLVGQCQLYVHTVYVVCACRQRCYSPGPSLLLCPQRPTSWSGPWCVQLLMSLKSRVLVLDLTKSDIVVPSSTSWLEHHNLCLADLIMHFQRLRVISNVE